MQHNTLEAEPNNFKHSLSTRKKVKIAFDHVNGVLKPSSIDHYRQLDVFKQSSDIPNINGKRTALKMAWTHSV